ncbi:MAG TPA: TolC family protein [Polyangiaceae bacterium]|nr:TolC family protein [Polyangiaceae bacterium]
MKRILLLRTALGGVLVALAGRAQTAAPPPAAPPAPPASSPSSALAPDRETELARKLHGKVGQAGGLTADQVAVLAVRTSTADRARRADVEAARSEVSRADLDYYPKFTATARYTRLSSFTPPPLVPGTALSFPVIVNQYLLQGSVVVPISDYFLRIGQSKEAAVSQKEAQEITAEATRRQIAMEARLAYYSWARARLGGVVTEQSVDQAKRHLDFSKAARDSGRAPNADVLRAESLVSAAELANTRMHDGEALALERLHTVMHDGGLPREIGEDLLAGLPDGEPPSIESLYSEAVTRRPEFRAFEKNEASLKGQRSAANSRGLPRLDAFGNVYVADPNPRVVPPEERWRATWDVGVQLTWSPNDLGSANATTSGIDAKQKRLDAERAALSDGIRDEIAGARLAYLEARDAAVTADRGLRSAEEAYRVRRELFELGRGTEVELIDAESDVLRARLEMIQAHVDARVARVRIDHATGRDVAPR